MPETAWRCDVCKSIYATEELALTCESKHVSSQHMQLHAIQYADGARLPSLLTFRIDPNKVDGELPLYVRYSFDSAGTPE